MIEASFRISQSAEEDTLLVNTSISNIIDELEEEFSAEEGQSFTSSHQGDNGIGIKGYMATESKQMPIQAPELKLHNEGRPTSQMPLTEIREFGLCDDEEKQVDPGDVCFQSELAELLDQGTNMVNEIYWKSLIGQFGKDQNQAMKMKYQNESNALNVEALVWLPIALISIVSSLVHPKLQEKEKPTTQDRKKYFLTKQNLMSRRADVFLGQVLRKLEACLTDSSPKAIQTAKAEYWSRLRSYLKRQCDEIFSKEHISRSRPEASFKLLQGAEPENSKTYTPHFEFALNQITKAAARRLKSELSQETTLIQSIVKALPGSSKGRISVVDLNMMMSPEFNSYLQNTPKNSEKDKEFKEAILKELANIQTASNNIKYVQQSSDVPDSGSSFNFHIHCFSNHGTHDQSKAEIVFREVPCQIVENAVCEVFQGYVGKLSEDDYTKALKNIPNLRKENRQLNKPIAKGKKEHAKIERKPRGSEGNQQNINQDSNLGKRTDEISCEEYETYKKLQQADGLHHRQCLPPQEVCTVQRERLRSSETGFAADATPEVDQQLDGMVLFRESHYDSPLFVWNDSDYQSHHLLDDFLFDRSRPNDSLHFPENLTYDEDIL